MISYSEREVFSARHIELWTRAQTLVSALGEVPPSKNYAGSVRCHELARAVGEVLGLEVQDGKFGWARSTTRSARAMSRANQRTILDVYMPGMLPQVVLVHPQAVSLPWYQCYRPGKDHTGIDAAQVRYIVARFREQRW